eukprot:TRINITY_DN22914_c0_g1_i1.p1 TRINITY_DN22914_c0_g1~~TRINITY_DN22914_c0_g1_i1.p1  ORF type:complete len:136 (+),score=21.96 TRINITY_DN22914_c0_g1_i1:33-440(+)
MDSRNALIIYAAGGLLMLIFYITGYSYWSQPDSNTVSIIWTTAPRDASEKLAKGLVETRIAACVNSIPQVSSYYKWEGKVVSDSEDLLMIKTKSDNIPKVIDYVKHNHPYTTPEVISVTVTSGLPSYLDWVRDST